MTEYLQFLGHVLANMGLLFLALVCAVGLFLSCFSISGTWLVLVASILAFIFRGSGFPGFGTILAFVYIAILVEVAEYVAGFWGVTKRGGSSWAGLAALLGGLLGTVVGALLPLPLISGFAGLLIGSFGFVYGVEMLRLKEQAKAVHIATGAVLARFFIVLLKIVTTLGMAAWLFAGIFKS